MFQKKVTIKKNGDICIEVSNKFREVKFDIPNGTSYQDAKKIVFEDFRKASYIFINPREVKDYPKFKLVIDEIIDSELMEEIQEDEDYIDEIEDEENNDIDNTILDIFIKENFNGEKRN